ncbi:MAG: hypothetical protein WA989_05260 [Henriciella sp.]|uniref:hypothetical protein n=1 Tax=Henriciella sp. TaxID=1968823 RepID=UPI003C70E302
MSPALVRYLEAGHELALAVEELIETRGACARGRLANAVWLVGKAQRSVSIGGTRPVFQDTMAIYRRVDGLRRLVAAWHASPSPFGAHIEDLADLAGPCRIVKRAHREAFAFDPCMAAAAAAQAHIRTHHHPRGERSPEPDPSRSEAQRGSNQKGEPHG